MKRILSLLLMAVGLLAASAGNRISLSSAMGKAGQEIDLSLSLSNTDKVAAVEVRVPLNRYLQYVDASCRMNESRSDGHQLSAGVVNDTLRIYVYSLSGNPLRGSNGELCQFRLRLFKTSKQFTLSPIVILADSQGNALACSTVAGQVTIQAPHLQTSAKVEFGEFPIRNTSTQSILLTNDGTETLHVSDIRFSSDWLSTDMRTLTIGAGQSQYVNVSLLPLHRGDFNATMTIVSDAINANETLEIHASPYSVNELHIGNAEGHSDEEVSVPIHVKNQEPLVAIQCALRLPDELKYVEGSFHASKRAEGLSATAAVIDGRMMLYLFSASNTPIEGEEGEVGTFRLKLNGHTGSYQLSAEDVILGNATEENMLTGTQSGMVTISSPIISIPSMMDMGQAAVTGGAESQVIIANTGHDDLVISKVVFLAEGFSIRNELPLVIKPNSSRPLTVCHQSDTPGRYNTTMQVYSNDPGQRVSSVDVSGNLFEPNGFELDGEFVGDAYKLHVALNNYTEIVAAQFDLHVPSGLEASIDDMVSTERIDGMTCTLTKVGENRYQVLIYSLSNKAVQGNTGEVMSILFTGSTQDAIGDKISLDGVILGDRIGNNYSSQSSISCIIYSNIYRVCYYYEGKLVHVDEVRFGSKIPAYEYILSDGTPCKEWDGEEHETMPAHDLRYDVSQSFLDGIGSIPPEPSTEKGEMYDLQGRYLQHEPARGVFTKDGRKWVK